MSPYPLFAFIGLLFFFLICYCRCCLSKNLCLFLYFALASSWVFFQEFNGDDMQTYLDVFGQYGFDQMSFYGNSLEFSIGLFSSIVKSVFNIHDPLQIAFVFRFFSFVLLPLASIFFSLNSRQSCVTFLGCIVFLLLLPYTWLSATNIINNGFSITCFTCLFISAFVRLVLFAERFELFSFYAAYVFLLIFLGIFSHLYGIAIFLFVLCQCLAFRILSGLRLTRDFGSFSNFAFFYLLSLIPLSIFGGRFLTSRIFDSTIAISSSILVFLLLASRVLMVRYFRDFQVLFRRKVALAQCWKHMVGVSFFGIVTGFFGGGDASERIVTSLVGIVFLFCITICAKVSLTSVSNLCVSPVVSAFRLNGQPVLSNPPLPWRAGSWSAPREFVLVSILLLAMNVYFYNSSAFVLNHFER